MCIFCLVSVLYNKIKSLQEKGMREMYESDITKALDLLYRNFQDEYAENKQYGRVSVVSNTHLTCGDNGVPRRVSLQELYLNDTKEVREIRVFTTLLPSCANFYIFHYPHSNDVFVIEWENDC